MDDVEITRVTINPAFGTNIKHSNQLVITTDRERSFYLPARQNKDFSLAVEMTAADRPTSRTTGSSRGWNDK